MLLCRLFLLTVWYAFWVWAHIMLVKTSKVASWDLLVTELGIVFVTLLIGCSMIYRLMLNRYAGTALVIALGGGFFCLFLGVWFPFPWFLTLLIFFFIGLIIYWMEGFYSRFTVYPSKIWGILYLISMSIWGMYGALFHLGLRNADNRLGLGLLLILMTLCFGGIWHYKAYFET